MTVPSSIWRSRFQERFRNIQTALNLFRQCSPSSASWVMLGIVIEGLIPILLVQCTAYIVQRYQTTAHLSAWIKGPALLYITALVGRELFSMFSRWIRLYHEAKLSDHLSQLIQTKASEADMASFESSTFYDRLHRAGFESENHVMDVVEEASQIATHSLTVMGLLWVVIQFSWWLPLLFLGSALPVLLTLVFQARSRYHWSKQMTQVQRKSRYFHWLLVGNEAAGEIRIFGLADRFMRQFKNLRTQVLESRLRMDRSQTLKVFLANGMAVVLLALGCLFIIEKIQIGNLALSSAALFGHSVLLCRQSSLALLSHSARLYRSALFLSDLQAVLDHKSSLVTPTNPDIVDLRRLEDISFDHVTFHYPGSDRAALKDVCATVPGGKITVVYGENGSGKSTLMKLLCRFFDPHQGHIRIGNANMHHTEPKSLQQQMGIVLQNPVRYYFSCEDNVKLGNISNPTDATAYQRAIKVAGVSNFLGALPAGEQTRLGKWFEEGEELSAGQWQRLAIARMVYSDRPMWIMDEPTSAMDPWSEHQWLKELKKAAKNRTVIIITHRLATAEIADHIVVMNEGSVIESGSPELLAKSNGKFAQLQGETGKQFANPSQDG